MVMLERLFLQAERCALADDRRRVRRDPGQCHPSSPPTLLCVCVLKCVFFAKKDAVSNPKTETENVDRQSELATLPLVNLFSHRLIYPCLGARHLTSIFAPEQLPGVNV